MWSCVLLHNREVGLFFGLKVWAKQLDAWGLALTCCGDVAFTLFEFPGRISSFDGTLIRMWW